MIKCNVRSNSGAGCRYKKRGYCNYSEEIVITNEAGSMFCDKYEEEDMVFRKNKTRCPYCENSNAHSARSSVIIESAKMFSFEVIESDDDDAEFDKALRITFVCEKCERQVFVEYGFNGNEMEKIQ